MAINAIWSVVGCLCSPKGAPGCANKVSESSPFQNEVCDHLDARVKRANPIPPKTKLLKAATVVGCLCSRLFCYINFYVYIYKLKFLTNTNRYV